MKKTTIYLISILLLFACRQVETKSATNTTDNSNSLTAANMDNLITGWYYLTDDENGIKRKLMRTEDVFSIDPRPIVTVKAFTDLEIYQSNSGDFGLTIKLDKEGTKSWSIATEKSIGEQLALIVDNELIYTPTVNSQIDFGITALNRGDLTEEELKEIKLKIESEKNE